MTKLHSRAEHCRVRAEKCRAEAPRVADQAVQQQLLELALYWDWMAQDIEQIERMRETISEDKVRWERLQRSGFQQLSD